MKNSRPQPVPNQNVFCDIKFMSYMHYERWVMVEQLVPTSSNQNVFCDIKFISYMHYERWVMVEQQAPTSSNQNVFCDNWFMSYIVHALWTLGYGRTAGSNQFQPERVLRQLVYVIHCTCIMNVGLW